MKFPFGSRSRSEKFHEPEWKIIKTYCKVKWSNQQKFSRWSDWSDRNSARTFSLVLQFFFNQREALSLIMEGKKTKTEGLKIVYFSTSIRRSSQMNTLEDYFFLFSDCSQSYVGLFLVQKLDLLLSPLTLSLNSNTIWQQQTVQNKSKIIQQHTQLRTFKTSWQMFGVTPDSHSCLP